MSTPSTTIKVAAVQMDSQLGEVAHNRTGLLRRLREAASAGARLVVFPECALTGYGFENRSEALASAEPVDGPSVQKLAIACAELNVWAAFGFLEREESRLFNACALVGPPGLIGHYRKVHLPFMGVDRFADRGDRPFSVVEAAGLRVGLQICYDGSFPEAARVQALAGADLIALPTNWPEGAEPLAEHMMACRAIENTVYTLAANRIGVERGTRFVGRSSIHGPLGRELARASADREETLIAEVDPLRARQKRIVRVPGLHELDRIADRRPEFYRDLVKEALDLRSARA